MNSINLTGRIVNELEIKQTNESKVLNFTLAVDRFKGKDKEKTTDFIPITVWGKQAESLVKYSEKGKMIAVSGELFSKIVQDRGENRAKLYVNAEKINILEWKVEDKEN